MGMRKTIWQGPSPQNTSWRKASLHPRNTALNVAALASRWQHCVQFDRPEIWTSVLPLRQRQTRYRSIKNSFLFLYLPLFVLEETSYSSPRGKMKHLKLFNYCLRTFWPNATNVESYWKRTTVQIHCDEVILPQDSNLHLLVLSFICI